MRTLTAVSLATALLVPGAIVGSHAATTAAPAAEVAQAGFATPEDAATALLATLLSDEAWQIEAVIGAGGVGLLDSGDKAVDIEEVRSFIETYADRHHIVRQDDRHALLVIGPRDWTLPIPLVRDGSGWHFDTADAARRINDRRVGRNEIGAIRGLLALADAQRAYRDATGGSHDYALRLISSNNQRDGLYWPDAAAAPRSPLADLADAARARGYPLTKTDLPDSYGGYRIKLLTASGPSAPGGAKNFLSNGRLTGGFAYLAWPARYGSTGLMTFLLGPDGTIFQKNLGPRTDDIADATRTYDPDLTWSLVRVTE